MIKSSPFPILLLILVAQFAFVVTVNGQIERLELGRRLQRFELAWQQAPDDQQAAAAQPMQGAVSSFFSLQLKNAAERLDAAWLLVRDRPTTDWQRQVVPLYLEIERPVRDLSELSFQVTVKPLYPLKSEIPQDYQVQLQIANELGQIVHTRNTTIQLLQQGIYLTTEKLPAGDYQLQAEIVEGVDSFKLIEVGFSLLQDSKNRLQQLNAAAADRELPLSESVRATLRSHADLLSSLLAGDIQEIDYPAARLLEFAESLIENPSRSSATVQEASRGHDVWITLRHNRRQVPLRLRAPKTFAVPPSLPLPSEDSSEVVSDQQQQLETTQQTAQQTPNQEAAKQQIPILILLHGAGGSENMFFQTYGAGRAVQLGLDRGWLVVAPRQGGIGGMGGLGFDVAQILDSLDEFFPIDRSQVYLMGHSMGAGQLIRQVSLHPTLPRAVAAVGGGNAIRNVPAAADLPWFVAAGELDFGLRGAQALKNSLENIGAARVTYKVYPHIEHMVIVQACLDDAFAFFDQNSKK